MLDIDRLLDATSQATTEVSPATVRGWRDDLSYAAELLSYALRVLSIDLGVLRSVGDGAGDLDAVVEDLPRVLASSLAEAAEPPDTPAAVAAELATIGGDASGLLGVHESLATVDLSSASELEELIEGLESQLDQIRNRGGLVDDRLRTVKGLLVEQYRSKQANVDDWLD